MSVFNQYPNLPGMPIEFKDGGKALRFDDDSESTDSLLLLGTAVDGPVMEPVAVDYSTAELLFGSYQKDNGASNGSTLVKAFYEAYEAGCRDIRLMRVTGSAASSIISASSKTLIEKVRHDEELGYIAGNAETTFELTKSNIILDSVLVYAKGLVLDEKHISYDCENNLNLTNGGGKTVGSSFSKVALTIKEDSIDSGASISMSYNFLEVLSTSDKLIRPNSNNQLELSYLPYEEKVLSIKVDNGTELNTGQYHVEGNKIVLNFTPASLDRFTVEYEAEFTSSYTETLDTSGNQLKVKSKKQVFSMSASPQNLDEVFLYIDGALTLNKLSYSVNANRLEVDLDYFDKGQSVGISFSKEDVLENKREIVIESIFGGAVYNQSRVKVYELMTQDGRMVKVIELIKPSSKLGMGEQSSIFSTLDFETFGDLAEAINTYSGAFKATTLCPNEDATELQNSDEFFRGGDDGVKVSKEEMFEALSGKRDANGYIEVQGAYQILENYQADSIVPLGVYADDMLLKRNQDFAYELALFCAINSYKNKTILGFIDTKPLVDTSLRSVQAHANYLSNLNVNYYMKDSNGSYIYDSTGNLTDLGKFISVVAGSQPLRSHAVHSLRECSPAIMYAASTSVLLPQSSPMNKKIRGTIGVKYAFSNSQLNSIIGNRLVAIGVKSAQRGGYLEGAFVIDAPTCAREGSEYGRLTTLKVFRKVADMLRVVADPYIGEPNSIESRNALSAAISKCLDNGLESGMFSEYSFTLVAGSGDALDESKLELAIRPPSELRKISTVMGIK